MIRSGLDSARYNQIENLPKVNGYCGYQSGERREWDDCYLRETTLCIEQLRKARI